MGLELIRAALRFARVPQEKDGQPVNKLARRNRGHIGFRRTNRFVIAVSPGDPATARLHSQ
jgi:hypothetical protein